MAYYKSMKLGDIISEIFRSILKYTIYVNPLFYLGCYRSIKIICSTDETFQSIPKFYRNKVVLELMVMDLDKNDLVVTISSSGNSANIINVIDYCNNNDVNTLSLSGLKPDNLSNKKSKFSVFVPAYTYGIVECCHQVIIHSILDMFMDIKEWNRDSFQNMSIEKFNL